MKTQNTITRLGYLAIDQYGQTVKLTEPQHPRKQLLAKLGFKHAANMFQDSAAGTAQHIGYIVNRRWFTIHEVHAWTGA